MKKGLAMFLTMLLMLTLAMPYACAEEAAATVPGFGGDVTVTLAVEDGKLTKVEVVGENETPGIGAVAVEELPEAMMKANSIDVEAISGASVTSGAVKDAAAEALAALGVELVPVVVEEAAAELEPVYTDVLVIGAGGAGLAAASAAKEAGVDAILVERLAFTGGSTAMSGGVMCRSAMEGDPEGTMEADDLYEHFMEISSHKANPKVVRRYVDNSPADNVWAFGMGDQVLNPTRYHLVPENIMALRPQGSGVELMKCMHQGAEERGVDIRLNTRATSLIYEDGVVKGAMVDGPDGSYAIYAKGGVVLATGGFAQNPELLAQYGAPNAESVLVSCSAGATGDGLIMARDIGADVQFGDDWDTDGYHTLAASGYLNYLNMVLVNAEGKRFIREDDQLPRVYTLMCHETAKGNLDFFFLTDDNLEPEPEKMMEMTGAVKIDTFEELVEFTGCDADTLRKTLDDYNAYKGQEDPATGKPANFMQGLEAPYYCVKSTPIRVVTIGGLVIDEEARVLDTEGQPIAGLYAGGEVANASFYYNVYACCGSAVQHAVTFGRIGGTHAAEAALAAK